MKSKTDELYELQRKRRARFPKDRIPFLSFASTIEADRATFRAYEDGKISILRACSNIANSNCLDEVTEEQFLKTCEGLGYVKGLDDGDNW